MPEEKPMMSKDRRTTDFSLLVAARMAVTLTVVLVLTAGAASAGQPFNKIRARLDALEQNVTTRLDTLEQNLRARIDALSSATGVQFGTLQQAIADTKAFIRSTHLVDPFDMTVNICATLGPDARIAQNAGTNLDFSMDGGAGIDFYGNGVAADYSPHFEHGISADVGAGISVQLTACINGLFFRQDGSADSFNTDDLSSEELNFLNTLLAGSASSGNDRASIRQRLREIATGLSNQLSVAQLGGLTNSLRHSSFVDVFGDNSIANPFGYNTFGVNTLKNNLPFPQDIRAALGNSFPVDMFDNFNFDDPAAFCNLFANGFPTGFDQRVANGITQLCNAVGDSNGFIASLEDAFAAIPSLGSTVSNIQNAINDIIDTLRVIPGKIIDSIIDAIKDLF
jgi:hypothetical protein